MYDTGGPYEEFVFNGKRFRQYRNFLTAVTEKNGEEIQYPISEGHYTVSRVLDVRDVEAGFTPGDIVATIYYVTFTPPNSEDTRTVLVTDEDMRDRNSTWPQQTGACAFMPTRRTGVEVVSDAIKAMARRARGHQDATVAYGRPGLLLRDGRPPAFLRPGKPALVPGGVDEQTYCELPPGSAKTDAIRLFSLDDPSTDLQYPDDLAHLFRFASTLMPADAVVPIALVSALLWAPWAGLPETDTLPKCDHLAVLLAGRSGIMKTAQAGVILGAQSSTFRPRKGAPVPATVMLRHGAQNGGSSPIGAQRTLWALAGLLALVDDAFADELSESEVHSQWISLGSLANSMAEQNAGAKAKQRGSGTMPARYPRCCIIATAEDLPNEDRHVSTAARFYALKTESKADPAALTAVQHNVRGLSRAHARIVQETLSDLDIPRRARAWAEEQVSGWDTRSHHDRAVVNATLVLAGWHLLIEAARRAGFGDLDGLSMDGWEMWGAEQIHRGMDEQARRGNVTADGQVARDPVQLFLRRFREFLTDGTHFLADPERADDGAAYPPLLLAGHGYGPAAVGWRQGPRVTANGFGPATQWLAAGHGDPLGAVHVRARGTSGPQPFSPVMLVMKSSLWDDLVRLVDRRSRERDRYGISDTPSRLLARLVERGVAKSAKPEGSALWKGKGSRKPDVLKFDLLRLLGDDITEEDWTEPDSGDSLGTENNPAAPAKLGAQASAPEFDPRCLACGEMAGAREPGDSAYWRNGVGPLHASCDIPAQVEPAQEVIPAQVEPAQEVIPAQVEPEQVPEPAWREPEHTGKSLAALRATLVRRGWDVPSDEFVRAVADRITAAFPVDGKPGSGGPGLVWAEGPGRTGYRLFRQEQSHGTRRLPPDERLGDVNCPWTMPRQEWHRPLTAGERQQEFFVSFDINGAYLAAASQPLGTGRPVHLTDTGRIQIRKNVPALYRLDVDPTTADLLPMLFAANGWYAGPIAWYLYERGLVRRVEEAFVWPTTESYVWLDRWYQAIRDARSWLAGDGGHDQAGRAALDCVKALYTTFLAGWMASPRNSTNLYRPDWRAHTVSRAAANQARALDKVREQTGRTPFAIRVDAVWFTANLPDDIPTGLDVPDNKKLGKWKPNGAGLLTPNVVAALDSGIGGVHAALREAATQYQELRF
ncbi:hypothetical protein [Candidatus Frankia alpina]|uniref:Uncharacterized protein n=1 Tax=Candidatus Frankia alpina TaxID=2699483 RepID=A0A4S5EPF9_9ACTN|nr:hypothetical protein [Candidatus Frankia alpina]THJ74194.1 hypothetical protein E7Y31_12915 [Candidatus Frankia alpina]